MNLRRISGWEKVCGKEFGQLRQFWVSRCHTIIRIPHIPRLIGPAPLPTKLTRPKSLNLPQCTNVTSRDAHCYLWPLRWVWSTMSMFCAGICTCWCRNVILKNAWSFPRLQVRYLVDPNPVPPSLWSDTVTDEGRSWIGIFRIIEMRSTLMLYSAENI